MVTQYWPEGNSVCERQHIFLGQVLRLLPEEERSSWPDHCGRWAFAVNNTPNSNTTLSPNQIEFGKTTRNPFESIFVDPGSVPVTFDERKNKGVFGVLKRNMKVFQDIAREMSAYNRGKSTSALNTKGAPREFQPGDACMIFLPPRSTKKTQENPRSWKPKHVFAWRGPCEILSRNSTTNYTVREIKTGRKFDRHIGLIAPYYGHLEKDAAWGLPPVQPKKTKVAPVVGIVHTDDDLVVGELIAIADNDAYLLCMVIELAESGCSAQIFTTTYRGQLKSAHFKKTFIEEGTGLMIRGAPNKKERAEPWLAYVDADDVLARNLQLRGNKLTEASVAALTKLDLPFQYVS
jgi:hypothetical protein